MEHPGPFGRALDQPGLGEKPEVARNPGLALVHDLGDLADRQVAFGEQGQEPEPGRLGGGPEGNENPGRRKGARFFAGDATRG